MALLRSLLTTSAEDDDRIVPLTEADLPVLRLQHHSRLQEDEAINALRALPGISQWHPTSGEYLLVSPWRHRTDILSFRELSAFHHESELVAAVFAAAEANGLGACITAETYERRRPMFYDRNGMALVETIITYHHDRIADFADAPTTPHQTFVPVTLQDAELIEQVIALDSAAFPWLWRNSPGEFLWWMQQRSVEVWAGMLDDRVVSYFGSTFFQSMGHLDRIAIHPDWQGQGLGMETLHVALRRMSTLGMTRAGLCTQLGNDASQHLYERAGFHRAPQHDYNIYGTLLAAAPDEAHTT